MYASGESGDAVWVAVVGGRGMQRQHRPSLEAAKTDCGSAEGGGSDGPLVVQLRLSGAHCGVFFVCSQHSYSISWPFTLESAQSATTQH